MISFVHMYGCSDDIVYIEVFEDGKKVFDDEAHPWKFDINGLMHVEWNHHDKYGWQFTLGGIDEGRTEEYSKYEIKVVVDTVSNHSPCLQIVYNGPIVIEGIYGGKKKQIMDLLKQYVDDSWQNTEELYDKLEAGGFLK
jgi:hypothetical protein